MRAACIVLLCFLASSALSADESHWSFFGELGSFNHGFQDREYVSRSRSSFPVLSYNLGMEMENRIDNRILGFGFSQSAIDSGRHWNYDQYETQPALILFVPYAYMGRDWSWIALELGLGFYFTIQDYEERQYLDPQGSSTLAAASGFGWNRGESFTLINSCFRIGFEDALHCKVRFAREDFSITENLFNIAVFLPWQDHELWSSISASSPLFIWSEDEGSLRSNQRWYLGYNKKQGTFTWGLRLGLLIRSVLGESGEAELLNRFCGGFSLSLTMK